MDTAVKRVESILKDEFQMDNYVSLVREIFSTVRIVAPDRFNKEFSNFSSHVEGSFHVGSYDTPDGKKIAIFAVALKQQIYVENSRSTQRSFAKKIIENGNCDAAMIAFYTPNDKDKTWRLSFVRLEYEMKIEEGKLRTQENLTPAKRYSYLVGAGEPCHTAIERFRIFITDNNSQPTLDDLEEAFSVEAVTKEFFALYCEKFYQLVEYLESNEDFIEESKRCGFTSEQFAKKLMGQIVFLYFLQKKGWLGVGVWPSELEEKQYKNLYYCKAASGAQRRIIQQYVSVIYRQNGDKYKLIPSALDRIPDDAEELIANHMPGDRNWGSGSRTFLRTLFEYGKKHKGHFYEEYLEPLFYDTLNKNRGTLGYSTILHCRIPFLSGGLFEPLDGYDWRSCYFDIPDEIFSNKQDDNDLMADGILDIFDRYNFTMSEDEPMEREVAIDPEMLGKVFENLLEVKDRKSKGAFYTPREIVHYMCQESLINYLKTNLNISEEAVRNFILYGDFYKDSDTEKTLKVTDANGRVHYEFDPNRELKISSEIFSPKDGVNRIQEVDNLLQNIRVADPAVGSGAFPLGMLNEIVRARQTLSAYMAISMSAYNARLMYINERSAYRLKYETVRNCIFAADIEPSAVDIAQLRLWLALVIDDEINPDADSPLDGHKNPLPLPNLECNIVCGNSLLDEFEGHKLIPQSSLLGTNCGEEYSWNQRELESLIPRLIDAQDRLFRCDEPMKKEQIKEEIAAIKDQMIRSELSTFTSDALDRYEESKRHTSKPFVLWQIEFARVFKEKGGFDIVIGNPPYVRVQNLSHVMIDYYKERWKTAYKRIDMSTLFVERGYTLINRNGAVNYISSNQFLIAEYGRKIREFLVRESCVSRIIDFGDLPVFENAMTYVSIFFLNKIPKNIFEYCRVKELPFVAPSTFDEIETDSLSGDSWSLGNRSVQAVLNKIKSATKDTLITYAKPFAGLVTGKDDILMFDIEKNPDIDSDMLLPVVRAQGCSRYGEAFANKKVMYPYKLNGTSTEIIEMDYLQEHFAKTYQYICDNEKALKERKDSRKRFGDRAGWYGLVRFGQLDMFMKPKIVTPGEVKHNKFCIDYTGSGFTCARVFGISITDEGVDIKYLLGILNSKVVEFFMHHTAALKAGGYYSYSSTVLEKIPLVIAESQRQIVEMVDDVMKKRKEKVNSDNEEKQIDSLVYQLYGLNSEEIEIIENDLSDPDEE